MPLDRDQFNTCIALLMPHMNTPDERQAFMTRALYGSPVLEQITWTGNARTFSTNLVRTLNKFDNATSLIAVLKTLRDEVGDPTHSTRLIDELIALAPSPSASVAATPATSASVFISYSRQDAAFVEKLRSDLGQHGVPYWLDKIGLMPGTADWENALRSAIAAARGVVLVATPDSRQSAYVRDELAIARMHGKAIYPVWVAGNEWMEAIPMGMGYVQNIDMRGAAYNAGLAQLVAVLRDSGVSDIAVIPEATPTLAAGVEPQNPYKGLQAFNEDDAAKFFGREVLTARLLERLQMQLESNQARFLAVLGPSGAGKSSVVMAGLLPALKRGDCSGSADWTYLLPMVPGAHPIEHLSDALKSQMPNTPLSTIEADLNAPGGRMLHRLGRQLSGERAVLYNDQFEELFTLTPDEGERQQFISLLTGAATEADGKLIILLSMRADFLDQPLNYPVLGDLFNSYTELVRPMSIAELRDAIEKPARLPDVGLTFDTGLVADIIFALRGREMALAGALPLLQFTLERLFAERDGTRLTRTAYDKMGGVEGAIGTHSETVFTALPQEAQDKLGQVFLPLVNIDENTGEATRRRAPLDAMTQDPDAKHLVAALVENRLLQTGREGDDTYLEIAHEALFRSWQRLVDWLEDIHDSLRLIRRTEREAQIWDERGRPEHMRPNAEELAELKSAAEQVGIGLGGELLEDFTEPEQARLPRQLEDIHLSHPERAQIGDRLAVIGDTRKGVGLRPDGVPEMMWLPVESGAVTIENERFTVEPFFVAKYLVTYQQFQVFIDAPDGYQNKQWWAGMPDDYVKQDIVEQRTKFKNNPRDNLSWYQVAAFSRWLTEQYRGEKLLHPAGEQFEIGANAVIRLPLEWEWQWAAQGGQARRKYPWGDWRDGCANTSEAGLSRAIGVGLYPQGAAVCGALDMAGQLREWCLNDYSNVSIVDYMNNEYKTQRGGSFYYFRLDAACASRNLNLPSFPDYYFGVRVIVSRPIL